VNVDYIAALEDVLDLYARPVDPQRPRVCLDETPKQLIAERRAPLPAQPGQPERYDYQYQRNGTCNLFMHFCPDRAWRHVSVSQQRTNLDFARELKWLVDGPFAEADQIDLVVDNLASHRAAVLYEAFAPAEARRIARKIVWHYTPKHGSWLNMAELEISAFGRLCWDRRIGDLATLARETEALERERNAAQATVHWQFSCQDARDKLHRLYPSTSA